MIRLSGPTFLVNELIFARRYTTVFEEYQKLLEDHVERLVQECDCTIEEFYEALKRDEDGETQLYIEIILAAADYENFASMVKSYKEK